MRFLSRFDIIELMMTPSFWIGVATVVFVTLLVYWLLTRLIAFVKKGITTWGDKHPSTNRMRFILTDMLNRTSRVLLFVVALLFSLRFVDLPDHLFGTVSHAWFPGLRYPGGAVDGSGGGVVASSRHAGAGKP